MKHILLVDDDTAIRDCFRQFFEILGYQCSEADNGALALKQLDSQSFSLIITDNQMPVMDGISFLESHYHTYKERAVPVIIVTGQLTSTLKTRARNLGIKTIFEKPCNLESLSLAVKAILEA